jgi:hypothetical protein
MGQQERHSLNLISFALPVAAVWMGLAFCAALGLAALALAAMGPGVHGTIVALKVTARFSFLLFLAGLCRRRDDDFIRTSFRAP